jgi:hypothetical protein
MCSPMYCCTCALAALTPSHHFQLQSEIDVEGSAELNGYTCRVSGRYIVKWERIQGGMVGLHVHCAIERRCSVFNTHDHGATQIVVPPQHLALHIACPKCPHTQPPLPPTPSPFRLVTWSWWSGRQRSQICLYQERSWRAQPALHDGSFYMASQYCEGMCTSLQAFQFP